MTHNENGAGHKPEQSPIGELLMAHLSEVPFHWGNFEKFRKEWTPLLRVSCVQDVL